MPVITPSNLAEYWKDITAILIKAQNNLSYDDFTALALLIETDMDEFQSHKLKAEVEHNMKNNPNFGKLDRDLEPMK